MKKILILMLVLMLVVLSTLNCYAAVTPGYSSKALPLYVGVRAHDEDFIINSSGKATMQVNLIPLNLDAIDKVYVTFTIKDESEETIYNRAYNMIWDDIDLVFALKKTHELKSKGEYAFQATYKCYKNDTLLETIKSTTLFSTY